MTSPRLDLTREQVLAYRLAVNGLVQRLPPGEGSLRRAAWAGLQDSMPRAAVLSIHARIQETGPATWEDPALAQVWGPRFSAYVVVATDVPVFTLGRLPVNAGQRRFAEGLADRLDRYLDGRTMTYSAAGAGLGEPPNRLRYATTTGRVLIRWEGARQPTIWTIPAPEMDPQDARAELARRYLRIFGPATAAGFARWAGVGPADRRGAFDSLAASLTPVRTPAGDGWLLREDEGTAREAHGQPRSVRLLPSGDAFYLLWGADRDVLVPDPGHRERLWTSRVWPGAVLVGNELVGTWRRAGGDVSVASWRRLSGKERQAVKEAAVALPLPGAPSVRVSWEA